MSKPKGKGSVPFRDESIPREPPPPEPELAIGSLMQIIENHLADADDYLSHAKSYLDRLKTLIEQEKAKTTT